MTFKDYRLESKGGWGTNDGYINLEQLNTGALLRIADATEVMAKNYAELMTSRDHWECVAKNTRELYEAEKRRTAALRGIINRMKKETS